MEERRYLISDAAKLVAVEAHVLRYWEEELSLSIGRTELGHRYYTREDIELFQKVKRLKEEGLQLRAIRVVLQNMGRAGNPSGREARDGANSTTGRESGQIETDSRTAAGVREDAAGRAHEGTAKNDVRRDTAADNGREDAAGGAHEGTAKTGACEDAASTGADDQAALAVMRTNAEKLEQFTELVQGIVEKVVRDNNAQLQRRLEESMARETSYLLHMQEQQAEEHFRQLDEAIRARQKNGRYVAAAKEKRHFWDRLRR